MKRVLVIALAIVCGVAFSEGFAKKPKKQELDSQQAYRDSVTMAEELQRQKEEMQLEKELLELKRKTAQEKLNSSFMEEMGLPCQEEAKSTEGYYGAWAVSDGCPNQSFAVQSAMQKAQRELARQIGGEEVVIEDAEVICRTVSRDGYGNFYAYVAIRVPKK